MGKTNTTWVNGYEAGLKKEKERMLSNYDSWKRSMLAAGNTGSIFDIADLAIRQVMNGTPTGQPANETEQKETPESP